ncbi:MAG: succinate--CoA ligase subunit beta [Spirochaetes bacterium RBG_16_49_21]|nr:MAG: succinate--CoA ligase subunit beta [Spirochaetes bacterium RBG_16_49_21]
MKIHEYQAKYIFKEYGIPVPVGELAKTPEEAKGIAEKQGGRVVVKAQVHAGGRGKGGGIKIAGTPEQALEAAKEIMGKKLVTPQTGSDGISVRTVLVEEVLDIERELYVGIVIDRASEFEQPVFVASKSGGMEIEEIARKSPESIVKVGIHPFSGFKGFHGRRIAAALGLEGKMVSELSRFLDTLYRIFMDKDASLVEINPLVVTKDGKLCALDAKINFDDDALYRHPEIKDLKDINEESPLEVEASRAGINYIKLSGDIGCMVNGAGLAMATMDLIKLAGGEPANFMDVGGGATPERVEKGFKIFTSDKNVKAILVNIFGGILRCDRVATGIVEAAKNIKLTIPMVVRLQGTNSEEGRKILKNSNVKFEVAEGLFEAAQKVVALTRNMN